MWTKLLPSEWYFWMYLIATIPTPKYGAKESYGTNSIDDKQTAYKQTVILKKTLFRLC